MEQHTHNRASKTAEVSTRNDNDRILSAGETIQLRLCNNILNIVNSTQEHYIRPVCIVLKDTCLPLMPALQVNLNSLIWCGFSIIFLKGCIKHFITFVIIDNGVVLSPFRRNIPSGIIKVLLILFTYVWLLTKNTTEDMSKILLVLSVNS